MQVPKFNASALIAMLVATASYVQAQQPAFVSDASCKLVTVTDNFKGQTKLDASKWFVQNSNGTPKFTAAGLELHLSSPGQNYVIASQKSFYRGSFTIMMKGFNAPGFVSTAVTRPPAAIQDGADELDIVELVGARPSMPELVAWHKSATAGGPAQFISNGNAGHTAVNMGVDMTQSVHNYTTVWDTNSVKWYFDNKNVYTVNLASSGIQRLTQAMQFKFGPWISSGSWSGNPDFTKNPDPYMLVESVSVTGCQTADAAPAGSSSSVSSTASTSSTKSTSTAKSASTSSTKSTSTATSASTSSTKSTSTATSASSTKSSTSTVPTSSTSVVSASTTATSVTAKSTPVTSSTVTEVQNGTTYVYQASGCTEAATGATPTGTASANGTSTATTGSTSSNSTNSASGKNSTTSVNDLLNSTSSAPRVMIGSSFMALAGGLLYSLF